MAPGQLGDGTHRTGPHTGRLLTVLAGPVVIGSMLSVPGAGAEVDHHKVVAGKFRISVGLQLIPIYL